MVVPSGLPSFHEALRAGAEIYQVLKKALVALKMTVAVGDEGGFAPKIKTHAEVLDVLAKAIADAGYAGKVRLALDCAASEYFKDDKYTLEGKALSSSQVGEVYAAFDQSGTWKKIQIYSEP